MKPEFNLSAHWLSVAFWETVFERVCEELPEALPAILSNYRRCEAFRKSAGYNTGSISVAAGACLYAVCRYFGVGSAVEIGTFIGKSTSSMALALGRNTPNGIINTCDKDNACFTPWEGIGCQVRSFAQKTSTEMLTEVARSTSKVDLFYFDGRIAPPDVPLILQLSNPTTLYAFDDFEGTEKGVANVANLRGSLKGYVLIEPCAPALLQRYGIQGRSLCALLFNTANLNLTAQ
jgi:predicted O-methyltransferase YrrM